MGVFTLLAIYIREMFFSILALFGIEKTGSSYMQTIYIAVTLLSILIFLYQMIFKLNITKKELGLIFAFGMLLVAFLFIPRIFYRGLGEGYQPIMLTAFSSVLSAFLLGIVARRGEFVNALGKAVPIFVLINTVSSTIVAFTSSGETSTGFIKDDSGFNYQDLSYFIAFTFALNVYYIKNQHRLQGDSIFKRSGWNTLFQCLIPVHMLCLLLAGGRGAFVLVCILTVYYFIMDSGNFKKNLKNLALITIAVFVAITLVTSLGVEHSGFDRILDFLGGAGDENRTTQWERAFSVFLDSPIIGHGAGSVFPVLKWYSHNVFTDIMVEYGAIGLVFVVVLLVKIIKRLRSLVQENPSNHLIVVVFMWSFTVLMFSGYYLSNPALWFVIGYVFSTVATEPIKKRVGSKYVKTNARRF